MRIHADPDPQPCGILDKTEEILFVRSNMDLKLLTKKTLKNVFSSKEGGILFFFISSLRWLKAYFLEKLEPEQKSETEPAKKPGAGQKRTATLSTTLTLTGTGIYLNS